MWQTLAKPWRVCLELSWISYCEGSAPIAAVITDMHGEMVASGRNCLNGQPSTGENWIASVPLAHAEINALLGLDDGLHEPSSVRLYTTVEPCPLCIGAICMGGVKSLRFAARNAWSKVYPRNIRLGRLIFESGEMSRMRD